MVTLGEVLEDIRDKVLIKYGKEDIYVFNCSFDFYDSMLGIALEKESLNPVSGIWITEQIDGAEHSAQDWIEFFVSMLVDYIKKRRRIWNSSLYFRK